MLNSDYSRQRILDAAYDLFGRIGYAATTVRMIAQQADVSLSAIPYHFESKGNLYQNVISIASEEFADYFSGLTREITDFLSRPTLDAATARTLLFRLNDKHIDYVFDPKNERQMRLFFQIRTFAKSAEDLGDLLNLTTTHLFRSLICIIKPELDDQTATILTYSIIGEQLFFFYHRPSVLLQLDLKEFDSLSIEQIRRILDHKLDVIITTDDF
ncbi:MAG TPA: CerR family C-terminal domain-containing protein [Eubacteriales bacterium]|nr:CerR family C-terminal domain-containing protein [Eubacteriales bacterium]